MESGFKPMLLYAIEIIFVMWHWNYMRFPTKVLVVRDEYDIWIIGVDVSQVDNG